MKPREWINKHKKGLRKKFIGKTVLVCGEKVVKVFDGSVDPLKVNEEAKKICEGEWCYTYLPESEEEYLL